MKSIFVIVSFFLVPLLRAQDPVLLINKLKAKIEKVNDYQASGIMKTNVPFLKVPVAEVKIFFKRPDKLKIKNEKGISLVPKGALSMSLGNLLTSKHFTAIISGSDYINGIPVKIIKLLPLDENTEIVLSTLFVDEANLLIMKAVTTTRDSGTYELAMEYGPYADYALPAKAVFTFNTK